MLFSWKYEKPYNGYDLYLNEYLLNKNTWGNEQFVLVNNEDVIAYVACQIFDDDMWVGWALKPELCGNGIGNLFIKKCINELIRLNKYNREDIFLKVVDWNKRAIRVYEKVGFIYHESTVREEEDRLVRYCIMKKNIINK